MVLLQLARKTSREETERIRNSHDSAVNPATILVIKRLWKVPMVQCRIRLNTCKSIAIE